MVYDIWGFLSSAPHWLVYLAGVVGLLALGYLCVNVWHQLKAASQSVETINAIRAELSSLANATEQHFVDTAHASSQAKWADCDIQHCIHLQQVFTRLDKLAERFDEFDRRTEETRANTSTSLSAINIAQKELGKDLGRELGDLAKTIMSLLVEDLRRRDTNR